MEHPRRLHWLREFRYGCVFALGPIQQCFFTNGSAPDPGVDRHRGGRIRARRARHGYLTIRLRGAFFAIATLALAVVLQTLVVNWNYVGGARGAYVIRPQETETLQLPYIQYLS